MDRTGANAAGSAAGLLGSVLDAEVGAGHAAPAERAPAPVSNIPSEDDPNFALRLQLLEYEELEQSLPEDLRPDESDLEARLALLRDIAAQQYMMEQHQGVAALFGAEFGDAHGAGGVDMDEVGLRALQQLGLSVHYEGEDEDMDMEEEGEEGMEGDDDGAGGRAPGARGLVGMARMADLTALLGTNLAGFLHTHLANAAVDVDSMSYEELLEMCDNIGTVNVGLDEAEIEKRTVRFTCDAVSMKHLIVDGQAGQCTVCMTEFEEGDELRKLSCVHCFHTDCIDQWLDKSKKCPVCKTECLERVPFEELSEAKTLPSTAAVVVEDPAHASPAPPAPQAVRDAIAEQVTPLQYTSTPGDAGPSALSNYDPQSTGSSSSPPARAKKPRRAAASVATHSDEGAATPAVPSASAPAPPQTSSSTRPADGDAVEKKPKKKRATRSAMLAIR